MKTQTDVMQDWIIRSLCSPKTYEIAEWTHTSFVPAPTFFDLQNASISNHTIFSPCPEVRVKSEKWGKPRFTKAFWKKKTIAQKTKIIKLGIVARRFDPFNPFEGMHIFVNFFWVRKLLGLGEGLVVLHDKFGNANNEFQKYMWSLFSRDLIHMRDIDNELHFDRLIVLPSSGVSRLNYYNNPFRTSRVVLEFSRFVISHVRSERDDRMNIIISKRGVYMRNNKAYNPGRSLSNWNELIPNIQANIPAANLKLVDFSSLKLRKLLTMIDNSQALVGVHGAGMVWSTFMRQRAKLFEIFGGNRGVANRHYKNIAKYVNLTYEYHFSPGLRCDSACENKLIHFLSS